LEQVADAGPTAIMVANTSVAKQDFWKFICLPLSMQVWSLPIGAGPCDALQDACGSWEKRLRAGRQTD